MLKTLFPIIIYLSLLSYRSFIILPFTFRLMIPLRSLFWLRWVAKSKYHFFPRIDTMKPVTFIEDITALASYWKSNNHICITLYLIFFLLFYFSVFVSSQQFHNVLSNADLQHVLNLTVSGVKYRTVAFKVFKELQFNYHLSMSYSHTFQFIVF